MINLSGASEENFEVKESLAKKKGWVQCTSKPRKFLSNRSMLIETKIQTSEQKHVGLCANVEDIFFVKEYYKHNENT